MEKVEEEKKTKAELKAEKKVEAAAAKKIKVEEKAKKKAEAKAEKKAKKEEQKNSKFGKEEDNESVASLSLDLSEEPTTTKRSGNRNRLILIVLASTLPAIMVIIMYATGVIVKDQKVEVSRVKIVNNTSQLIGRNRYEKVDFEMASFFIPLRSGDGIVKLKITLKSLRGDWKKRILMNPGLYRNVVIGAFEESLVKDLKRQEGQQAAFQEIESKLRTLMEDEVLGGIIVREFNLL